jgi:hypothetical protein
LDISPLQREVIVKSLQVQDYVEGPVIDVPFHVAEHPLVYPFK